MDLYKYKDNGLSGLVNLGNTCFMNSAIQCLSNTLLLTDYFLKKKHLKDLNKKKNPKLAEEWYRLLEGIWSDNCIISPNSFNSTFQRYTTNKQFHGFHQNDVQEFLLFFIDGLHEALSKEVNITISGEVQNNTDKYVYEAMTEWKKFFKDSYSKIIELFYGQIMVTTRSLDNKYESRKYDPMCYFTLPIPTNSENVNIYDCFDLFTSKEVLDKDNKWLCEESNEYVDAQRDIKLLSSPKILIILFKRFTNNNMKINTFINFPEKDLDLGKYSIGYDSGKAKYDLVGVCVHRGNHHYAYCKNANDKWYQFNDSQVTEAKIKDVISNNAYCLFYSKNN
jgi:ubiquitin C-terminal hydrolase